MYFEDLHRRLIEVVRRKIRSGELTERGLARLCGISQPHMHNVLKNIRDLSDAYADRLLRSLDLTVPSLLWQFPGEVETGVRAIPVLRGRLGAGAEVKMTVFRGYTPIPLSLLDGVVDPVAARLAPDPVLPKMVAINDLVLLDQNPLIRKNPRGRACWVVSDSGVMRVRYVKLGGTRIYLAHSETVDDPKRWEAISLQGRNILDIVRARIVWIGREMEKEPAGPADPVSPRH